MKATTIVCVRRGSDVTIAGDGQVTLGNVVVKEGAKKIRRIYGGEVLIGFAGSVSDAISLSEMFEGQLKKTKGDIIRAAVELTREWRKDKVLRKLESMMIVSDKKNTLLISGGGEVIEPENEVIAIGSGGDFARSAALALCENTDMTAKEIAKKSLEIAAKICIYTNNSIILEEL